MIKRYHEAPKSMFAQVQKETYGDYALVHLLESDEEYSDLFKYSDKSRHVILDNSAFELGEAVDMDLLASWVKLLHPEYYIVPDVLEDADATIAKFRAFIKKYPQLPGKRIGVVQGASYKDVVRCYNAIEPLCDKVAFSFDFSWWLEKFPVGADKFTPTKWHAMMRGRIDMLQRLVDDNIIYKSKPHHLLGCALPQELKYYAAMQTCGEFGWIDSVDTSNPVVHGIKHIGYTPMGLDNKESQKLCELIDYVPSQYEQQLIMENIKMFGRFCDGN